MGLSSNQARFLSITARKCDLEYRMQQICNRRLRLSNELQGAARTYDDQTSDRKLFLKSLNTDSLQTTGEYDPISEANLEKNGYYIMDTGSDGKGNDIIGTYGSGNVIEVNAGDAAGFAAAIATKPDANIVLKGNLDLSSISTIDNFKGKLYANGNTITSNKAIFNTIDATAGVYDMNLNIKSGSALSGGNSGFLANSNAGTIDNVVISSASAVSASSQNNVGLLTGTNNGTISNVSSTAQLTNGGSGVGNITGTNNGFMTNVLTTNTTSGDSIVGGIAGLNNGTITKASELGSVAGNTYVGGISGLNNGNITSVLTSGAVGSASATTVGGIAGSNASGSTISDSYSVSSIDGTGSEIGGLVGTNSGTVAATNVFIASEAGDATTAVGSGSSNAQNIAILTASNIDSTLEPTLSSTWNKTGAIPVLSGTNLNVTTSTSPATRTESVTQQSGTDFTDLAASGATGLGVNQAMYDQLTATYGSQINGTDLKIVQYQAAIPDGTGKYTYQNIVSLAIMNAKGLQEVDTACNTTGTKSNALSSNYVLTNDIDLGASSISNWTTIGNKTDVFTGKFDGNMHNIDNLTIKTAGNATYQGMFGNVGAGGSVMRTNLKDEIISIGGDSMGESGGSYPAGYVGGLVGYNNGTIENSSVDANITVAGRANQIGGVVGASGETNNNALVNKCSSTGTLSINTSGSAGAYSQIGGLAGWLKGGAVTYSSSSMDIKLGGTGYYMSYVAPLLGDLDSSAKPSVNYCFAKGTIKKYSDNSDISFGNNIANGVNYNVIQNSYYKDTAGNYYYYGTSTDGTTASAPGQQHLGQTTDWNSVPSANDQVSITSTSGTTNKNVWKSDGTLNPDATNTVIINYTKTNVDNVTSTVAAASNNKNFTSGHGYTSTDIYSAIPKTLDPNVSLEEGLRSGRYQLVVNSDMQTQNPVKGSNTGDMTFEKVDWRTQPIISDELDTSNDAAAQTTYDRVVRDVDEQDKLLQMEQEKISTEYQAITSEKDAVKKILDTNAQGSFKYFS